MLNLPEIRIEEDMSKDRLFSVHRDDEPLIQYFEQCYKTGMPKTFEADVRRIVAVCAGDEEMARSLVVRGLRELADEIERGGGKPRVRWDEERKIPLMNTD